MLKNVSIFALIGLLAVGCSKKDNIAPSSETKSSGRVTFSSITPTTHHDTTRVTVSSITPTTHHDTTRMVEMITEAQNKLALKNKGLPVFHCHDKLDLPFVIYKLNKKNNENEDLYDCIITGINMDLRDKTIKPVIATNFAAFFDQTEAALREILKSRSNIHVFQLNYLFKELKKK